MLLKQLSEESKSKEDEMQKYKGQSISPELYQVKAYIKTAKKNIAAENQKLREMEKRLSTMLTSRADNCERKKQELEQQKQAMVERIAEANAELAELQETAAGLKQEHQSESATKAEHSERITSIKSNLTKLQHSLKSKKQFASFLKYGRTWNLSNSS